MKRGGRRVSGSWSARPVAHYPEWCGFGQRVAGWRQDRGQRVETPTPNPGGPHDRDEQSRSDGNHAGGRQPGWRPVRRPNPRDARYADPGLSGGRDRRRNRPAIPHGALGRHLLGDRLLSSPTPRDRSLSGPAPAGH